MESVKIPGRIDPDQLLKVFFNAAGKVDYKNKHTGENSEVVILTASRFYLRYRNTVAFALISYFDGIETKIDYGLVGFGSGAGVLGADTGVGNEFLNDIEQGLKVFLKNQ